MFVGGTRKQSRSAWLSPQTVNRHRNVPSKISSVLRFHISRIASLNIELVIPPQESWAGNNQLGIFFGTYHGSRACVAPNPEEVSHVPHSKYKKRVFPINHMN